MAYQKNTDVTPSELRQWLNAFIIAFIIVFILRTFIFGLYLVPTGSGEPHLLVGDRIYANKLAYRFTDIKRGDLVIFENPEFTYQEDNIRRLWQKYLGIPIPFMGLQKGPENWVKRVIAFPGDTVQGKVESGKTVIYLNGKKLNEKYVNHFPLLRVQKTTGFFKTNKFLGLPLPASLQKTIKNVLYTFDPDKKFEQQPFYHITRKEVLNSGGIHITRPFTPDKIHPGAHKTIDAFGPIIIPEGKYWVMGDNRKNSKDSRHWGLLDKKLVKGRASFIIFSIDSQEPLWLFELVRHPLTFWTKQLRSNRFFKSLNTFNGKIAS